MEHQGTTKARSLANCLNRHADGHWESFHKSLFRRHFWESRSSELRSETPIHVSVCRKLKRNQNVLIGNVKCCVVINVETFPSQMQLMLVNHSVCIVIQCPIFKVVLKQNFAKSATAQEWNFLFGLAQTVEAYLKTYLI